MYYVLIVDAYGSTRHVEKFDTREAAVDYIANLPDGEVPLAQTKVVFAEVADASADGKVTGHVYTVDEGWHFETAEYDAVDSVAAVEVGSFFLYELA